MKSMMETVLTDTNGNGKQDQEDVFGYLGASKMVLPSFWIGAGEKSMEFDEDGIPILTMTDERFVSVIEKVYAMTYENNARIVRRILTSLQRIQRCSRRIIPCSLTVHSSTSLLYVIWRQISA